MIRGWELLRSEFVGHFRIFDMKVDHRRRPSDGHEQEFIILDAPDWVVAVAVTKNDEVVMIRQWRAGSDTIELEVPGGMIDPKDPDPLQGGLRELREETGFTGSGACVMGEALPNSAFMDNHCYFVYVEDCAHTHERELDPGEEIETVLVPVQDVFKHIENGDIRHPLVISALTRFAMKRGLLGSSDSS